MTLRITDLADLNPDLLKVNGLVPDDIEIHPVNESNVQGGIKAQKEGAATEQLFDDACDIYLSQNRPFHIVQIPPKFKILGETVINGKLFKYGYWECKGAADRHLTYKGRSIFVEIKSVSGENSRTLTKSLHQYDQMLDATKRGQGLAFYLVRWRRKSGDDWRYHDVRHLHKTEKGIRFVRSKGHQVPVLTGLPDFLIPLDQLLIHEEITKG